MGEGMEEAVEAVKGFVASESFENELQALEETGVPLPKFGTDDTILGPTDISRFEQKKEICVITPDRDEDGEGHIADTATESHLTVSFFCKGRKHSVLQKQAMRYAAAFRKAVLVDGTLGETVRDCELGETTFFLNAGTVDKQMSVTEIDMTVKVEHDL